MTLEEAIREVEKRKDALEKGNRGWQDSVTFRRGFIRGLEVTLEILKKVKKEGD